MIKDIDILSKKEIKNLSDAMASGMAERYPTSIYTIALYLNRAKNFGEDIVTKYPSLFAISRDCLKDCFPGWHDVL
ncbi:MAG TPA: hypothetical protein O0X25_01745 [Methanocorpusculum sp.]|nr:hypothetical protein [Methanocorpusculum sp.]HJJ39720.1 hypothetical protein [Methanocorpusculum sp.]HJJ49329.1 hypothetical protein [Methanocorpusculum sp.]HJJ56627.1 hypothetical protein [Methanocorpusculum sp.]